MYVPVFFAAKVASRTICTTYRQYTHIHTNTTKIQQTYIHIHTKIHADTYKNTYIKQVCKKNICCLLSAIFACICMYACCMCAICKVLKSIHMCMYCTYVHTCVYMLLHLSVLKSIHMCIYCMYWHTCVYMCIHVYICRPHTGHIYSFMCRCPQKARNILGGGAATSGPHSGQPWAAALPLYPVIRGPIAQTRFGVPVRPARVGEGESSSPAPPMGPPRAKVAWRSHPEPRPSRSG
jgi:hypothetical protein